MIIIIIIKIIIIIITIIITEKLEKAMSRLHFLQFQYPLSLLQNSISVPKLLYTFRTSEFSDNPQPLKFDKLQRKCITDVININMNDI